MEQKYNLLEQSWIPTVDRKYISLTEVFSDSSVSAIGGNPVEKICLFKLFMAIAQRALNVKTENDLYALTNHKISEACLEYLNSHKDLFYLYGDKPFLQVPGAKEAKVKTFNEVSLEIATGNTSVVYCSQRKRQFQDKEIALLLLTLNSFAPGGKKTDNSVVLSFGYGGKTNLKGNPASAKAGPSLGFKGYLHSYVIAENLIDTIRLNIFSEESIMATGLFSEGLGIPPWEELPKGEDDVIARRLKESYMGRLVPMSRFMYLAEEGLHFTEGIAHASIYDGKYDLSMSVDMSKKKPICLWADPNFNHWKHFLSLFSFIEENPESGITCEQLKNGLKIAHKYGIKSFIWSGGLKISSKAGEQYCSGADDYVECIVPLNNSIINEEFYTRFKEYYEIMKKYDAKLYFCVRHYCEDLKFDYGNSCNRAKEILGNSIDESFNELCDIISKDDDKEFRRKVFRFVCDAFDEVCPATTESRIISWAKNNPTITRGGDKNGRKSEA